MKKGIIRSIIGILFALFVLRVVAKLGAAKEEGRPVEPVKESVREVKSIVKDIKSTWAEKDTFN